MKYKDKKIRAKSALLIAIALVLVILLVSCGEKHIDKNDDLLCDNCGKEYSDGTEEVTGDNQPDDDSGNDPDNNPDNNSGIDSDNTPDTNPGNDPDNNPGGDSGAVSDEPKVVTGYIAVTTTATYCYVDEYSFTAPITGTYTFTIPKGLGFITENALRPELDFQLSPNGGSVELDLAEGAVLSFSVGSTTRDIWNIAWQAVEGEVEIPVEPTYDIYIEANDEDGYTFTYTAAKTGNLVVTVTDFAYDWMGDGRFTVAGTDAFETGFPRMYALVINGESFANYIASVPVTVGDEVTIQLYCHYGYATKANIETTVNAGSGGNQGANYPDDSSYSIVLEAGDSDGEAFTYIAAVAGNIVITVPYLSYDYKGDGEYYVADADTLNYGFSKMYALVINGENVGANTSTISVKTGDKISIQLYCHHGYATNATVTVAYASSGSGNSGSTAPSGTETNPIILGSFPKSITVNSDTEKFIYYKITAQQSGTVIFTWPTADSWYAITELNADGSNTSNSTSGYLTDSFSFEVKAGTQYAISLGSWETPGNVTITITITEG